MDDSSHAAETVALKKGMHAGLYLQQLLAPIVSVDKLLKIRMLQDNAATVKNSTSEKPISATAKRYMHLDAAWCKDQVDVGEAELRWVASHHQLADAFTKPLPRHALEFALRAIRDPALMPKTPRTVLQAPTLRGCVLGSSCIAEDGHLGSPVADHPFE
jgi:hypothetical protein